MAGAAVALGVAAYYAGGSGASRSPSIAGEKIVGAFDIEKVASVEIGDKVRLAAGDGGWVVTTMQDYPADKSKIADNLMKLQELKAGQVVPGKTLSQKTPVVVKDAEGRELASVTLGERHDNWSFGRYAEYKGKAVLTGEPLDAFGDDPKRWCETKIVDEPWISFSKLAEPSLDDATFGFATGVVAKVTIAGDTNATVTVGATVEGGSERYLKIDGRKWVFVVPGYSVEKLLPKPEEPKDDAPAAAPAAEEPAPVEAEPAAPEAAEAEPAAPAAAPAAPAAAEEEPAP